MVDLADLDLCLIAGTLRRGGSERQLAYAVQALQDAGARLRVVSLDEGAFWQQEFRDRGIAVQSLACYRSKPGRLAALLWLLRRDRPRIVQSVHFNVNLYAVAAGRLLGCRDIGALRNDLDYGLAARGPIYGPPSLRWPRLLVVNSDHAMQQALDRGVPAQRLFLLPNVVDTDCYRPATARREGPFRILLVGRDVPQKRLDRFLRLLLRLRDAAEGEFRAEIVGEVGDGFGRALRDAGVPQSAVALRGPLPPAQVAAAYREADMLVLTSDFEGTPNAILEAMASALPCVATACGDVARILDGGRGCAVPTDDEDALFAAVRGLMAAEDTRRAIGRRARAYVEAEHALDRLPAMLQELYSARLSG